MIINRKELSHRRVSVSQTRMTVGPCTLYAHLSSRETSTSLMRRMKLGASGKRQRPNKFKIRLIRLNSTQTFSRLSLEHSKIRLSSQLVIQHSVKIVKPLSIYTQRLRAKHGSVSSVTLPTKLTWMRKRSQKRMT